MLKMKTGAAALIIALLLNVNLGEALSAKSIQVKPTTKSIRNDFVQDEIIVKYKQGVSDKTIAKLNSQYKTSIRHNSCIPGLKRLTIPKGKSVSELVRAYESNPNVEYAEPNYIAQTFMIPDDSYYAYQWNFDDTLRGGNPYGGSNGGGINLEPAWDLSTGAGTKVAVVDTGVAYENNGIYGLAPDLAGTSFWVNSGEIAGDGLDNDGNGYKDDVSGWDFINNDNHPNDDEGHGTHVTGTIAQSTNNGMGTAGVAFGATIMPVKVLDSSGSGEYLQISEGIRYAVDNGAQILNLSFGGLYSSITLQDSIAYAYSKGTTIVAAAGNSASYVAYPAAYDDYVIAVGATRYDETRTGYSGSGSSLDLMAPGGDLSVDQNADGYGDGVLQQTFGIRPTDWGYWFYEGTSMASPHVAGVAALLISYGVSGPSSIRNILQSTAEDKGTADWDPYYGWGIVDAMAALRAARPNNSPIANAGGPYTGTEDIAVSFDGSASSDPDSDPLTYKWNFGDGSSGTGVNPNHTYSAGGAYTVTLVVNDGKVNSSPSATTAEVAEVNDLPVITSTPVTTAIAGTPYLYDVNATDPDAGDILTYSLVTAPLGMNINPSTGLIGWTPTNSQVGSNNIEVKVADSSGASDSQAFTITVSSASSEITAFGDSFEIGEWNGLWTEDSQNDWFRSNQRAIDGSYSAEVDGNALDAKLISNSINLLGKTNAKVSFSWYIESSLDAKEYIAFDISTNGGVTWTEKARLRGNADPENTWHNVTINLSNINNLKIRVRGRMSQTDEDANVDNVKVIAW